MESRPAEQDISDLRRELARGSSVYDTLDRVVRFVAQSYQPDKVSAYVHVPSLPAALQARDLRVVDEYIAAKWQSGSNGHLAPQETPLFQVARDALMHGKKALTLPLLIGDLARGRVSSELAAQLRRAEVNSFALFPLFLADKVVGWLELRFSSRFFRFYKEDRVFLQRVCEHCSFYLEKLRELDLPKPMVGSAQPVTRTDPSPSSSVVDSALLYAANFIFVSTDSAMRIVSIRGDTERLLGLSAAEMLGSPDVWTRFIHSDDLRSLAKLLKSPPQTLAQIDQEIRIINRVTAEMRWFSMRAKPLTTAHGAFCGWEGFGIDITDKKRAEHELTSQSRRVEALYEVSRALQGNMDPALLSLRGLRALISATNSDCGFACFVDPASGQLELVAAEGLSAEYLQRAPQVISAPGLIRNVIESRSGVLLDNIQRESRAAGELAKLEGLRSSVVMPLIFEEQVLGALAVFCRRAYRYKNADFELVEAGCRQIALAARQAESYAAEKRQASSLAALYRLSHELSKFLTPREIVEHAFPIIQSEIACKRMWMGVINEQGTHVVGQGGFGPGVRGRLVNLQIELDLRHDFFDQSIRTKQPVIVERGTAMECSGLNRLVERLGLGTFVIVPLVSLGQVVGVLFVEPSTPSTFFAQRKLPLLTNMAAEIATMVLARRFEAKMAEAAKMRMASLLASGVAHNFNNLLQAVMGQASLVEMQTPAGSQLSLAARTIIEAAGKGATLIKQLLSFSMPGSHDRKVMSARELLLDAKEFYESALGASIKLSFEFDPESPQVHVDYGQLQQVITNMMVNAREALLGKEDGEVKLVTRGVRLLSGEVDPELAPGAYLRIDVEDNGVGMDAEKVARCFEPFFTTKNVDTGTGLGFHGSGLGLSSAYSIVKQHDGIITVRSEPKQGSVFSIYLPSAETRNLKLGRPPAAAGREPNEALIIDYDRGQAQSVQAMLSSFGVQASAYDTSEKALERLRGRREEIGLVFIDIDRSGFNVLSFIRLLRTESKHIRIGAACVDVKRWRQALKDFDNVMVLSKPLVASELRSLLSAVPSSAAASLNSQVQVVVDRDLDLSPEAEADSEEPVWTPRNRQK